jgi:hypothetical protein
MNSHFSINNQIKLLMESKVDYLLPNGDVIREEFRHDLIKCAHERKVSLYTVLKEFFASGEFTKVEMGRFALNTSASGNLLEGAMALIHVLGVTQETAPAIRVMEDYLGVRQSDPYMWGISWTIDSFMNWPLGTILPSSKRQLDIVCQRVK